MTMHLLSLNLLKTILVHKEVWAEEEDAAEEKDSKLTNHYPMVMIISFLLNSRNLTKRKNKWRKYLTLIYVLVFTLSMEWKNNGPKIVLVLQMKLKLNIHSLLEAIRKVTLKDKERCRALLKINNARLIVMKMLQDFIFEYIHSISF